MRLLPLVVLLLFTTFGFAQKTDDMAGMDMSNSKIQTSSEMPGIAGDGTASAMHAMESHHMDMGPHMKMTALRSMQPGDQQKADAVVQGARAAAAKYQDYKVALADGYKIFLPNLPQRQYHFTNYWYAFRARRHFNPTHRTSLLYEKQGDDYKLIGVMYTARKDASEDDLNSRIPLSVAQWHAHAISACLRKTRGRKRSRRTQSTASPDQSQPKRNAMLRVGNSTRRFSVGWCTSTHSSRSRKTSGRSNVSTITWTKQQREREPFAALARVLPRSGIRSPSPAQRVRTLRSSEFHRPG
jgi:hypothetical protein